MTEAKTFGDELLACESCGKSFVFGVPEQRRMYEARGVVVAPAQCPACRQKDTATGKRRGEVKWFDPEKGYGFIRRLDGRELFFHRSSLLSVSPAEVRDGQAVLFDEVDTAKGPEATDVELAD